MSAGKFNLQHMMLSPCRKVHPRIEPTECQLVGCGFEPGRTGDNHDRGRDLSLHAMLGNRRPVPSDWRPFQTEFEHSRERKRTVMLFTPDPSGSAIEASSHL